MACALLAGVLGQGHTDIVRMMQEQGTFHALAWVVMRPSTSRTAANCLGRLANSPGQAGVAAQVGFQDSQHCVAAAAILHQSHKLPHVSLLAFVLYACQGTSL